MNNQIGKRAWIPSVLQADDGSVIVEAPGDPELYGVVYCGPVLRTKYGHGIGTSIHRDSLPNMVVGWRPMRRVVPDASEAKSLLERFVNVHEPGAALRGISNKRPIDRGSDVEGARYTHAELLNSLIRERPAND